MTRPALHSGCIPYSMLLWFSLHKHKKRSIKIRLIGYKRSCQYGYTDRSTEAEYVLSDTGPGLYWEAMEVHKHPNNFKKREKGLTVNRTWAQVINRINPKRQSSARNLEIEVKLTQTNKNWSSQRTIEPADNFLTLNLDGFNNWFVILIGTKNFYYYNIYASLEWEFYAE